MLLSIILESWSEKIIISKTNKPPTESLLVLDGTSGQNSLSQVKKFQETIGLTGVVITKLDSTSKAGFAISVSNDYDLPIKFIGTISPKPTVEKTTTLK